jgi:hypothetical protein
MTIYFAAIQYVLCIIYTKSLQRIVVLECRFTSLYYYAATGSRTETPAFRISSREIEVVLASV